MILLRDNDLANRRLQPLSHLSHSTTSIFIFLSFFLHFFSDVLFIDFLPFPSCVNSSIFFPILMDPLTFFQKIDQLHIFFHFPFRFFLLLLSSHSFARFLPSLLFIRVLFISFDHWFTNGHLVTTYSQSPPS